MESTIVAVGKEFIFAIPIKKLLRRPPVAVTPEVVLMVFTWIIMITNAIFCWILSEISSSGKKDAGVNKKYTPKQYLCRRNVIKTINVIYKYGIESNQQARVDCGDHQSGT